MCKRIFDMILSTVCVVRFGVASDCVRTHTLRLSVCSSAQVANKSIHYLFSEVKCQSFTVAALKCSLTAHFPRGRKSVRLEYWIPAIRRCLMFVAEHSRLFAQDVIGIKRSIC